MNVYYNFPSNNNHINNLAFIRAILIRDTINKLDISSYEKKELKTKILEYLKDN